jgi:hypothetical protein
MKTVPELLGTFATFEALVLTIPRRFKRSKHLGIVWTVAPNVSHVRNNRSSFAGTVLILKCPRIVFQTEWHTHYTTAQHPKMPKNLNPSEEYAWRV